MGRLFIFLLGVLAGASGVFYLYSAGLVEAASAGAQTKVSAPSPVPPVSGLELPARPSAPSVAPTALTADAPSIVPLEIPAGALPPPALDAPGVANANVATAPTATAVLPSGSLMIPVAGVNAAQLSDTFTQSRGEGRLHDAIDIMTARGTPVVAVADGRVVKLFNSKPGGLTVYQFDGDEKLAYYYAHLDSYAPGLKEGDVLKRGDPIGMVGSTGNASPQAPHLHFAIFVLGPEKSWWKGTAINPYPILGGRAVRPAVPADAPEVGTSSAH